MSKHLFFKTLLILIIMAFGAMSSTCIAQGNDLAVSSTKEGILIKNTSGKTLYYRIYPNSILPLIEWAPCTPRDRWCTGLQPGEEVLFTDREPSTLFWWEILRQKDGTPFHGEVFSVTLSPE